MDDELISQLDEMQVRQHQRKLEWIEQNGPWNQNILNAAIQTFELNGFKCVITVNRTWPEMEKIYGPFPVKRLPRKLKKRIKSTGRWEGRKAVFDSGAGSTMVGYNGYVIFPQKPVIEPGYEGILTYVPVHGGITYAEHDELGSIYGFDTAHPRWRNEPTRDKGWTKQQLDIMIRGILRAAALEEEYLKADGDNKRRAEIVDQIRDITPGAELNFGEMINLMFGEL